MKFVFAFILALALPLSALAAPTGWKDAPDCVVPPDHGVWSADMTTLVGCITDEAWQAAQADAQARGNIQLPYVAPGATLTDEMGVQYTCEWYIFSGCNDLTHTDAYRATMRDLARQLVESGYTAQNFPMFAGWIQSVQ